MSVTPGAVRIDVVGGFVLQKVTPERSYFRLVIMTHCSTSVTCYLFFWFMKLLMPE